MGNFEIGLTLWVDFVKQLSSKLVVKNPVNNMHELGQYAIFLPRAWISLMLHYHFNVDLITPIR